MAEFKVGDRVRVKDSYKTSYDGASRYVGAFGRLYALGRWGFFRYEGGGTCSPELGTEMAVPREHLELVGEPIKAVADKTDQELADEYRAAYVVCDETRRELEKRGYSIKTAGHVHPALTAPLATVEFERVVTNVEKV